MGIAKSQATGGTDHFLGTFVSLVALQTAHPTATLGDYAIVEALPSEDAIVYFWDGTNWDTTYASANFLLAANNLSDVANAITSRSNLGLLEIPLASDETFTSGTLADLTGLGFAIVANGTYRARLKLAVIGAAAGIRIAFTFPAGCTVRIATSPGTTTSTTVQLSATANQTSGVDSAFSYCQGTTGWVELEIYIGNGANAGTFQVQRRSTTNTQSNTISAGLSYLEYRRTA